MEMKSNRLTINIYLMQECMREVNDFSFSSIFHYILLRITVIILSVRGTLIRKFMLVAHALGMTNGEYVFLDVEIFQVSFSCKKKM